MTTALGRFWAKITSGSADEVPEPRQRGDLYVDSDGNRYTTEPFGLDGEPWQGAFILTPSVVRRLREEGRLPLTEKWS